MENKLFTNKFEEAGYKERIFFNNLNKLYNLFPIDKYIITQNSYCGNECYDYLIQNRINWKCAIIEIKIRTAIYDSYVYESAKHKSLSKVKDVNPEHNTIFYINSTPKGTYIWNIDKVLPKYKSEKKEMNKATMTSNKDKSDKSIYLLKPEDAMFYEFHYDEKQFIEHLEAEKIKTFKEDTRAKDNRDILAKFLNIK